MNGDGNGVGGENGDGERDGAGTRTGAGASEETQDVNEQWMGAGTGGGTETGALTEMRTGTSIGTGPGRKDDGIGEVGGEANKRKKPHKSSCRRDVGNRGNLSGK